jgi:hypothetical protein
MIKKQIFKFILRFSFAFLVALITAIWVIQEDEMVQTFIKDKILYILENEFKAKIDVQNFDINLFTGTIFLKDGIVSSCKPYNQGDDFYWKFNSAEIKFSRLFWLFNVDMQLDLKLINVSVQTVFKGKRFAISGHIENVLAPSEFPIELKSIEIENINLGVRLEELSKSLSVNIMGNLYFENTSSLDEKKFWQGVLFIKDANILIDGKKILSEINGFSTIYKQDYFCNCWDIKTDKSFKILDLDCSLESEWNESTKQIKIISKDKKLNLCLDSNYSMDEFKIIGISCLSHFKHIYNFFTEQRLDKSLTGTCNFFVKFDVQNSKSIGSIKFDDAKLDNFDLGSYRANFEQNKNIIKTNFSMENFAQEHLQDVEVTGNALWDLNKNLGWANFCNRKSISLNDDWLILPQDFDLNLNFGLNSSFNGNYKVFISEKEEEKRYPLSGSLFLQNQDLGVSGKTNLGSYVLNAKLDPQFYLTKVLYTRKGKRVIDLNLKNSTKSLVGKIRYSYLRSFLPISFKKTVLGRNVILYINLDQDSYTNLKGFAQLSDGKLSVLGSYNPINKIKFDFNIDFLSRIINVQKAQVDFFKGKISMPYATMSFTDGYKINYIHAPIQINDLFVNWKKDFYGLVYGNLMLNKKHVIDKPQNFGLKIFGDLIFKKSLFKENIFSQNTSNDQFGFSFPQELNTQKDDIIEFDINVLNEGPIKTKTSFLEADANVDLNLKALYVDGKLQVPQVDGNINLEKGLLKFLHHKLFISYGKVQFFPNQLNDPIIDLVAKNKIRKYLVTLQATGSLQYPNIVLESSPELTEEEILALLIAGSENASFQTELPAILMQNLNNLIVGSKDLLPRTTSFFEKLTRPFKYVQITPNFTDQSGRGGIKGTVSIDLSKQIHAQIQKDFNLQEDFAFQLEYFLTDDVNLKVVKDQRGEIGSEVEVRFKL